MNQKLCHECETVSHCSKNGCIPKVEYKPITVLKDLQKKIKVQPQRQNYELQQQHQHQSLPGSCFTQSSMSETMSGL